LGNRLRGNGSGESRAERRSVKATNNIENPSSQAPWNANIGKSDLFLGEL
jgi:hypothetical protein